jgi:tRNA(fMet)-specific endonuclease VapC
VIRYVLDTDSCIYWLKGNRFIDRKINSLGAYRVAITPFSTAELYYGAYHSFQVEKNLDMLDFMFELFRTLELVHDDFIRFGKVKADLARRGRIIGNFDIMIASMCLERDLTVVTHNQTHFLPIEGLRVEDWTG